MKYEVKNDGTILNDHSEQENSEKCIKNEVYDDDNVFNDPPRQVDPEELVANPESVSKVGEPLMNNNSEFYDLKTGVVLASDGKKGFCRVCNKTFSKLGNAKAHFQKIHM